MKELLIGCGNSRQKRLRTSPDAPMEFTDLTTVDMDDNCKPDFVWDLNRTPWPLAKGNLGYYHDPESVYDEVHAYEVLEHLGQQGDIHSFFDTFTEIYRVLKPGGFLCATCPSAKSEWAWGDPGHTRIISGASLTFLDQTQYQKQIGVTSMTDYRWLWKGDFELYAHEDDGQSCMFILRAHKPTRTA